MFMGRGSMDPPPSSSSTVHPTTLFGSQQYNPNSNFNFSNPAAPQGAANRPAADAFIENLRVRSQVVDYASTDSDDGRSSDNMRSPIWCRNARCIDRWLPPEEPLN